MSTLPIPAQNAPLARHGEGLSENAQRYAAAAASDATRRAYRADFAHFAEWCKGEGRGYLPADPLAVAEYLSAHAGQLKASTLSRRLSAITKAHAAMGLPNPCAHEAVRMTARGIRRTHGAAKTGKTAFRAADLKAALNALGTGPLATRNRALLLLGYAGAFRRSELVGIEWGHVKSVREGLIITLPRSKTDQEGEGRKVAIPKGSTPETCPVRAVAALKALMIGDPLGPVFRPLSARGDFLPQSLSDRAVSRLIKSMAASLGMEPGEFGGHSLRAGLITDAYAADVAEAVISETTGHRSTAVMRGYRREADRFRKNAFKSVGL